MMDQSKRIRLIFEDDILSEAQKAEEGLNRSWFLLNPHQQQHATISDVVSHLLQAFKLHDSCPNGLILSISGFVLPAFESTCILKDNEVVRVRKRRNILSINGNEAANQPEKLEQQPRSSDILLLANGDGGHESEVPDAEGLLENSHRKKRKRKSPEKLRGSKKSKRRAEKSSQVVVLTKEKLSSEMAEKVDSDAEDYVKNKEESAKFSEESDASVPGMKRNAEVQDNMQVTEDAEIASEEMIKVPSRSARRKYAKRRLLREMAKVQKSNAACESEGLRNWKEDHAKTERNKVDDQLKGPQNWKKQRGDAKKVEVDGQSKGLLHWKQSPQSNPVVKGKKCERENQNVHSHKHPSENSDVADMPSQNGDGQKEPNENAVIHEQPNKRNDDVHEQTNEIDGDLQERPDQNGDAPEPSNQDGHMENEVVPVMIRPGHIRFEPLEKEDAVQHNHVPSNTFQWNGITSKKKGQKWGLENTARNDYRSSDKDYSESLSNYKEKQMDERLDFDKLPLLPSMPKEGDLIAYRVLELSSSWTPELSAYRVGKVSLYHAESNQIVLVAVSEYPIVFQKTEEDEDVLPDNPLYKEDGTLEIEFSSLVDVRIVKSSEPRNGAISWVTDGLAGKENASKTVFPSSNGEKTKVLGPESGGVNVWDQISQDLNAKKEQLSKDNSCGKIPNKVQGLHDNIAKNVSPLAADSREKNTKKVQPSQENSQRKQSSVDKSWTYKALRGSALGPTMAMLRSKQDI